MTKIYVPLVLFLAINAAAFTPPADFILTEMAKRTICGQGHMKGIASDQDEIYFVDLKFADDSVMIVSETSARKENAKAEPMAKKVDLHVVQTLLSCNANVIKKLKEYLVANKIDTSKVSQGFVNFDPVFIIGEEDGAHISVDKSTFLPLEEKSAEQKIEFSHWTAVSLFKDKKWPSTITKTRDDKVIKLDMSEMVEVPKRGNNAGLSQ